MAAVPTVSEADNTAIMERVLLAGDLSKLSAADRLFYYGKVCESVGLNPLTRPFDYLTLNGKMVLYAKRDATDQLRRIHKVSVTIKARETIEGVYVVTANAKDKTDREDESTGAVNIQGLKGDVLANALMKAETKAKRRVTLSICGLGMLDETEIETIPNARIDPRGDAPQNAPPRAVEVAVEQMRAALASKVDENVYRVHDALNKDQDTYIEASGKLTPAQRREWHLACGRHKKSMAEGSPDAQAYANALREALDAGIDEQIKELHEEISLNHGIALEVSTLVGADAIERVNAALDRLR